MRVGDMDSGQSSGSRALWTQQRCPPALHGLVSISLMGLEHFLFLQLSIFLFYGRNLLEELSQPQVKSSKCRQNVPFELESGCGACFLWGFPGGSVVKSSPAIAGAARDVGLIPGSGSSPGGGNGYPLQYSFLENPMDRGPLVSYSPWGGKELDTTEWLTFKSRLYNNLEGWDGEEGGRDIQKWEAIGTPMADSCWCLAETNTIL